MLPVSVVANGTVTLAQSFHTLYVGCNGMSGSLMKSDSCSKSSNRNTFFSALPRFFHPNLTEIMRRNIIA